MWKIRIVINEQSKSCCCKRFGSTAAIKKRGVCNWGRWNNGITKVLLVISCSYIELEVLPTCTEISSPSITATAMPGTFKLRIVSLTRRSKEVVKKDGGRIVKMMYDFVPYGSIHFTHE